MPPATRSSNMDASPPPNDLQHSGSDGDTTPNIALIMSQLLSAIQGLQTSAAQTQHLVSDAARQQANLTRTVVDVLGRLNSHSGPGHTAPTTSASELPQHGPATNIPRFPPISPLGSPATAASQQHHVCPEDIGLFDGTPEHLEFFRGQVDALIHSRADVSWEYAIVQTFPLCLRDTAAHWYQLLSTETRLNLGTWVTWHHKLCCAFCSDDGNGIFPEAQTACATSFHNTAVQANPPSFWDHCTSPQTFSIDPSLVTLSIEPKVQNRNPDSIDVKLPHAKAMGSGRAWAHHLPTAVFVGIGNSLPCLSLVDTGSTLSIIGKDLATGLCLCPFNGPGIHIFGIVNKAISVLLDTTISPRSHQWVQINHDISIFGSYLLDSSAWLSSDGATQVALPSAMLDLSTCHVLITNLADMDHKFLCGTPLGIASPFGPQDISVSAANFLLMGLDKMCAIPDNITSSIPGQDKEPDFTAEPLDFEEDDLARPLPTGCNMRTVDDTWQVGIDAHGNPHEAIVSLLRQHRGAFSLDGRPGLVTNASIPITTRPDDVLKPEAPRRVSPDKRRIIEDTLDQLLDWDVIEPSSSNMSYPVLLVKQGKKWWFCVDFRGLNASTVPDRYLLPRIDDVFEALAGNQQFSVLDATRGYHQIEIDETDCWKAAFVCHKGLFQYKRIPFRLRNAPSYFQWYMDGLLGSMCWTQALVYIDNVVVFSPTLEQHVKSLDTLLSAAEWVGLRFSPVKCQFAMMEITLLG
ncbi:uncharacterized protein UBRO_20211 [Ustilago bromivora]|uniref:Reverse transcriptase domain-containing protein n=1 Tax=Ustilago bromivora TaxID=307758 RepID=A0A1K0FVE0_9BASI|nr:uncharacterized protein UBRO_20211 [Ustilago bromivora]